MVNLDDHVSWYVNQFVSPAVFGGAENVTLAQLANFQAGLLRSECWPAIFPAPKLAGRSPTDPTLPTTCALGLSLKDGGLDSEGYNTSTILYWLNYQSSVPSMYPAVTPQNSEPQYSNLQIGLLGVALDAAIKAHPQMNVSYSGLQDFFIKEVAAPLGMTNTVYAISPALRELFPGPRPPSPLYVTDPFMFTHFKSSASPFLLQSPYEIPSYAGGMTSTATDMAKWMKFLLQSQHPTLLIR